MDAQRFTIGAEVRIDVPALGALIAALRQRGYEVIGPVVRDAAISYQPVTSTRDLPAGWTSEQQPGSYRLKRRTDGAMFAYAVGPGSLKHFLHPAETRIFTAEKDNGAFRILPDRPPTLRRAFLGVRACELAAAGIQDRVFLEDSLRDTVVIAVHCTEPAATCFCTSAGTGGPRVTKGFDLALTEGANEFLVEVGSALGADLLAGIPNTPATAELSAQSRAAIANAGQRITRRLDPVKAGQALQAHFDHPQWDNIAARCLACGNCTMVCPTCFCVNYEDTSDITGQHAERWSKWDSCFTLGFSYIHGGSIRLSTKSRYRQWLTHKLSYWTGQFGTPGCVGCGRCITWCPVGIDITKEVEVIQHDLNRTAQ